MPYVSGDVVDLLRRIAADLGWLKGRMNADDRGVATVPDVALIVTIISVAGCREFSPREVIQMAARPGVPDAALDARSRSGL